MLKESLEVGLIFLVENIMVKSLKILIFDKAWGFLYILMETSIKAGRKIMNSRAREGFYGILETIMMDSGIIQRMELG